MQFESVVENGFQLGFEFSTENGKFELFNCLRFGPFSENMDQIFGSLTGPLNFGPNLGTVVLNGPRSDSDFSRSGFWDFPQRENRRKFF